MGQMITRCNGEKVVVRFGERFVVASTLRGSSTFSTENVRGNYSKVIAMTEVMEEALSVPQSEASYYHEHNINGDWVACEKLNHCPSNCNCELFDCDVFVDNRDETMLP